MWLRADKQLNAQIIKSSATDAEGVYWVHRHHGEHSEQDECWCDPLRLTFEQISAYMTVELQEVLDRHFRLH